MKIMLKKIFRLKVALSVIVLDAGLLLLFPWGWGGYCPGLFGYGAEGGALGLCVSQTKTVSEDILLILIGITLIVFFAYIAYEVCRKVIHLASRK